jgi:hypothetical protein
MYITPQLFQYLNKPEEEKSIASFSGIRFDKESGGIHATLVIIHYLFKFVNRTDLFY